MPLTAVRTPAWFPPLRQTGGVRADELRHFLVVTDSDSSDVSALYPTDGAVAGFDCVSVPLGFSPGDLETVHFSADAVIDGEVLWAGSLSFPSGTVLVTNQSMRPLHQHQLEPGTYDVVISASGDASLQRGFIVSLVRTV